MRVPKFNIGDMFFMTHDMEKIELILSADKKANVGHLLHIPTVGVITEIKITKKDIRYTVEEHFKTNTGVLTRMVEQAEEHLLNLHTSIHSLVEKINVTYNQHFATLVKEINKEKLTGILKGE